MGKAEILDALPRLSHEELAEVSARLDELAGDAWLDGGTLTDDDRRALDAAIAEYEQLPDTGSSWGEVKARLQAKLQP